MRRRDRSRSTESAISTRPTTNHRLRDPIASSVGREQALERFRIVRPSLEDGVPLARLAREHGLQLRRLQRWVRAYRQQGLDGLAFHARADQGQRRPVSVELEQLIEGLALRRPPLSRAARGRRYAEVRTASRLV